MLSFCSHTGIYEECIEVFERKAEEVAHQWAKKPKEDQGILPETNRQKKRSVLIDHLFDILYDRIRTHPRSPKHIRQKTIPSPKANLPPLSLHGLELKKRLVQIDEPFEDVPLVKKQRSQSSGRSTTHNNFSEFKDSAIFVESVPTDSCQINTGVGDAVPSSPQLDKLKLDFSHRLGRRFGHDRFFELCVPALTGKGHLPDVLKSGKALEIIQDWLIDTAHPLIGRFWQPFFVKPKEKRKRNRDIIKDIEEVEPAFRIYLFATSGPGFQDDEDLIKHPDPPRGHPLMSIAQLLNRIRPTRKNEHQSYLKLFQRTSLAVSRNRATVTLSKDQIRFREKDIYSTKGEVMNDGAARISPTLAGKIALMIGLDLIPSVFQGRFGEAKGLWVVDYNDKEGDDWIEIYPSQQKWTRSNKHAGESDDISHRTFEVLEWSRPPKSATLNTQFVPILMDRARDKESMKESLSELVRSGLSVEIDAMIAAMDDPLSFYEWVRKCNPNFDERLKTGAISFQGGMPVVQEEKLNLLLGSGFDPRKLTYMRDIAKDVFKDKCNNLQDRLKIKVGRSAYLYMVPDFWGVLEPDEVYIDFSSFTDGINGLSNVALDGSEVLVARSPAHYPSDIQSVKAVTKVELIGLKNVIVFSTKGSTDGGRSLASKLSGGDYDGDQAWVCWEPSIVSNFITADMPEPIDLVTEGFMKRDTTTYADLKREHQHTTSVFLKKSFAFNMKRSLLGICTNFKERVACTQRRLDTPELRYLCQLASDLVDAPKQGFTFGDAEFELLKREKVKIFIKEQLWKTQRPSRNPDHHIIDHLMYVAHKAVLKALTYFHETFNYHSAWDDDLASYGRFALAQAEKFPDWKLLMEDLKKDIQVVQDKWIAYSAQPEHSKLPFSPFCEDCYADFQAIMPHDMNTSLAQSLLPDSGNRNSELSNWALLKASTLFASYSRKYVAKRVWWLAGIQLCHLKPDYDKTGRPYSIVSGVHLCMKPDGSLIRRRQAGAGVESNLEEVSVEEDMAVIND
ncbi:RNA dependent RNA polymerase-domain-containing protein [Leptodontidium sp. 2 PMI_412]|nr:RNA dependent RNA polymerase-domain-containing protein [Leptodontidium sp. 2 PMI_412]